MPEKWHLLRFLRLMYAPVFFGRSGSPQPFILGCAFPLLLCSRQLFNLQEAPVDTLSESKHANELTANCMCLQSTCRFSNHAVSTSAASRETLDGLALSVLVGRLAAESPGLCVASPGVPAARFLHSAH